VREDFCYREGAHSFGERRTQGKEWGKVGLGTGETNNYNDKANSKRRSSTRNVIRNETMNPSSSQPETCHNKTSSNSTRQKCYSNELIKLNQNDVNKQFDDAMLPIPKR
jgi:hypothetical protein